jgi:DHA1 family bicyclomycin/chloramphenicol resistance-like MFS transporter
MKISESNLRLLGFTALLGMLSTIGPVGLDTFLASIPKVAQGLNTSTNLVTISISAIMLGNAVGILFHGPFADRFGRKPVILVILGLFIFGALGSALAPNVEALIGWRFVQGIAMSGGRILVGAVARDKFSHERLGKFLSDTLFVTAIATVIGPYTGGQLALHFPWQSPFLLMAGYGVITLLLIAVFFKETVAEKNTDALSFSYLISSSVEVARDRVFLRYVFMGGLMISGFIAFLSASPTIMIKSFGLAEDTFGLLFSSVAVFFMLGTFISGRLVLRIGQNRLIAWGSSIALIGGLAMVSLAVLEIQTPAAVFGPMAVYATGLSMVMPQANASALQPFPKMAGMASSVQGFIQSVMAAGVSFSLTAATNETALAMASVIAGVALINFLIYVFSVASRTKK